MSQNIASFSDLDLSAPLLQGLLEVGYESPTPIQAQSIPPLLAGRDLLGQAQTGTGKTAAFALPLLSRLKPELKYPQLLVLTPTRELALQVAEAVQTYARYLPGFQVLPVYGGQNMVQQLRQLQRGVQAVVGTPGRIKDHLNRGTLKLDKINAVVIDEADEMLKMGFIEEVEEILSHAPPERQTALFSATMPQEVLKIARRHLNDPVEIRIKSKTSTVEQVSQRYWQVKGLHKLDALTRILEAEEIDGMIIFVRTKIATVELAEKLEARGFSSAPLNGDMTQVMREKTVERLKEGSLDIVVATDVAARGLDVKRISHVINYDIPHDTEAYVHRIGRTGRAGRTGNAILFVAPREFRMLRTIERATRQPIEPLVLPSREAVAGRRVAQFRRQVTEAMENEELDFFSEVVTQLEREHEGDLPRIAAALAYLAQLPKPLRLQERERDEVEHQAAPRFARDDSDRGRPQRGGYESRDGGDRGRPRHPGEFESRDRGEQPRRAPDFDAGDRARPKRPAPPAFAPQAPLAPFRIDVGQIHEATTREIVGAIANESGLGSRYIGRIEIHEEYSTVELPADLPPALLSLLSRTRVRQRPLAIRPADPRAPAEPRERKRPPRREREAGFEAAPVADAAPVRQDAAPRATVKRAAPKRSAEAPARTGFAPPRRAPEGKPPRKPRS
jgi:ATP-dependent RNA helicase DeaD